MGDTSPKNVRKLAEKKHETQAQKAEEKQDNAEHQHHHHATPEKVDDDVKIVEP